MLVEQGEEGSAASDETRDRNRRALTTVIPLDPVRLRSRTD